MCKIIANKVKSQSKSVRQAKSKSNPKENTKKMPRLQNTRVNNNQAQHSLKHMDWQDFAMNGYT